MCRPVTIGCVSKVAIKVSTGSIYVKLTIYTVNRRIYHKTNTNPDPHIIDLVDTVMATSPAKAYL